MALNAYLRMKGETQGEIKGSVTRPGREDSILVIAANHEVLAIMDEASALPTGKHHHRPFVITKEVDRSSPLIYTMLANSETIVEWKLDFWALSQTGKEHEHYSVELTNARISHVQFEMLNNTYPENAPLKEREHVSFYYERIVWTWMDGGITAEDDWESPNV